jgi:discoidin domain receptor family protein 2
MPQGERRGSEVDLFDYTYDGRVTETHLTGGLGQLVDGIEGPTNFRFDPDNSGRKGYDWVGWKNDTTELRADPIRIVFEFDHVRNFSGVRFHVNNMFSKEVRVFRKAVLYFSIGPPDTPYQKVPVTFEYMRDPMIEFARNVIVQIPHRIAQTVRVDLYFDAKWMMISEVRFESGE